MKLPEAKGDQWNGESDELVERVPMGRRAAASPKSEREDEELVEGPEAPKTGMLDSQAPRIKKQVIANQHIVATTPHWLADGR